MKTVTIIETELTKYEHIQSVRLTDGARLVASRRVVDETTPVRWTIVLKDKQEMYIFDELQFFEDTGCNVQTQYATTELVELAKQRGFMDWQQLPVALATVWGLEGTVYQDPDPIHYPTD